MVLFTRPCDRAYYLDLATEQTGINPLPFVVESKFFRCHGTLQHRYVCLKGVKGNIRPCKIIFLGNGC